jgi:hypothetical protein
MRYKDQIKPTTADNRAYLASAIAFAKILLRRTSDTLETLSEIVPIKTVEV